jgi:hypothetical protein
VLPPHGNFDPAPYTPPPTKRIEKLPDGRFRVTARAAASGEERSFEVGLVMMATGRKPRTQGLGLEVRRAAAGRGWWGAARAGGLLLPASAGGRGSPPQALKSPSPFPFGLPPPLPPP